MRIRRILMLMAVLIAAPATQAQSPVDATPQDQERVASDVESTTPDPSEATEKARTNSRLDLADIDSFIQNQADEQVDKAAPSTNEPVPATPQADIAADSDSESQPKPDADPNGPLTAPQSASAPVETKDNKPAGRPAPADVDDAAVTPIPRHPAQAKPVATASDGSHSTRPAAPWYRHPLVALAAVLVLIALITAAMRRFLPSVRPMPNSAMRVLGRVALSGKQSAVLMSVGNRVLLVGITPDRVQTLTEITDPQEVSLLRGRSVGDGNGFDADFVSQLGRYEVDYLDVTEDDEDDRDDDRGATVLGEAGVQLKGLMNRLEALRSR